MLAGTSLIAAVPRCMPFDSGLLLCPKQLALRQAALHDVIHDVACQGLQTARCGSCWWG